MVEENETKYLWELLCVHIYMLFVFYANLQFYEG